MNGNYIFTNINTALPSLMEDLLEAPEVGSRAGRVRELTHVGITLRKPWERYILLPERKASLPAQIAETAWVLAGRNDIEWLGNYLPRAKDFSDDGQTWRAGYGPRMRNWVCSEEEEEEHGVDQLAYVVDTLRKDPLSRQAVISLWDPEVDTTPGKDIACNNWLSFSSRLGKLDLHVAVRSNDAMWGWSGINVFEWSTLQEVVAGLLGLGVGSLHFSITSFHLYDRHWAKVEKIVTTAPSIVNHLDHGPRFDGLGRSLEDFDDLLKRWFQLEYDIRTGSPLVDGYIQQFPEPMLRSWLRVLQWWWYKGDRSCLEPGTALEAAALAGVQPKREELHQVYNSHGQPKRPKLTIEKEPEVTPFLREAIKLHNEKHEAYGDSWKRRGEMLGIMANIARKVDRLGGAATTDETSADTAMDLMIYLAKYRTWLWDQESGQGGNLSDHPTPANDVLKATENRVLRDNGQPVASRGKEEAWLRDSFDQLEVRVVERVGRTGLVEDMLAAAYALAAYRWSKEQEDKRLADEASGGAWCGYVLDDGSRCRCTMAKNHEVGGSRYGTAKLADEYLGADADGPTVHDCIHTTGGRRHQCVCGQGQNHPRMKGCEVEV